MIFFFYFTPSPWNQTVIVTIATVPVGESPAEQ